VEEALAEYIKQVCAACAAHQWPSRAVAQRDGLQEEMDGSDKVSCDTCGERTASTKGLKIAEPPYLLQLQLKRFVFDYVAMDHQKLNDKVTFPLVLDLNQYAADSLLVTTDARPASAEGDEDKPGAACTTGQADSGTSTLEMARDLIRKNGPHVYELYAVLVHSGGARSGHYYAYIKDLDTQKWNSFNDSNVSPIEVNEVLAACGGDSTSSYGYEMLAACSITIPANSFCAGRTPTVTYLQPTRTC
jgi:ubiquitin carboxyl-terminal hydrolase 47